MCPHMPFESGCKGKCLLTYFARIAGNVGATIHNQPLNSSVTTSARTNKALALGHAQLHLRSLSSMCPHVIFEAASLGEGLLAQMTCIAKRSGNNHAAPMLYATEINLRSLSSMCPHVLFENGCTGKGLLAYFAWIAGNVGAATHNQPLNSNITTSVGTN